MKIGSREFDIGKRTYIMGILNITPDSFSDGGRFNDIGRALKRVEEMLEEGMDILDIGGESTRPGYVQVPEEEEISRILPVLEAVKKNFEVPISLDTCKSGVAKAGIAAGADLINDIWGLKYDSHMAGVIAEHQTACCLMHNRKEADYSDFLEEMQRDLEDSLKLAESAGIAKEKIILDPGVGFGKTYENNLQAIRHLDRLQALGFPVLLGVSRKSVVGLTLGLPVNERLEGSLAAAVAGVMKGCSFLRVHDVKEHVRAVRMAEAIFNA